MALEYPDNRKKLKHTAPWELTGTPRFDNPKKYTDTVRVRPAIRGHAAPFRNTTAPKPPEPEPEPTKPYVEPVPDDSEI